jgi:TolB-like protein/Tfp pilus assembly protein PilF
VAASLARGDREAALAIARMRVEDQPLDTEAQTQLIQLLLAGGDRTAALRQYFRYERRLRAEGLAPAPEMEFLIRDVKHEMESEASEAGSPFVVLPSFESAEPPVPRLVVLPFEHLGRQEDELFTEGLTDEITNRLAQLPGLAVIARTTANQYRNTSKNVARIRRELAVDYVLEGMVRWGESTPGGRVRISPQLIRASDSTHVWAETYEATAPDVFQFQRRVAERVAERAAEVLDLRLRPPETGPRPRQRPQDPDAHVLFVRGMRQWEERGEDSLHKALELFQRAIEVDPEYAQAYAGLADTYTMIACFNVTAAAGWLPKAKSAADRALQLDPSSAESHVAKAMAAYVLEWDLEAAEHHLRKAIELAPSNVRAHAGLGYVLCTTGEKREFFETIARAQALDPLSVGTNFDVGFQAWQMRDRDLAVRQFRLIGQLDPAFDPASYVLGGIYYLEGDMGAARSEWARMTMFGPPWETLVRALAEPEEAVGVVDRLVELAPGSVHWYGISSLCSLLGAIDQAFDVLEAHYRNLRGETTQWLTGGPSLLHLSTDPFFDALRPDPRYDDLLHRIGLG